MDSKSESKVFGYGAAIPTTHRKPKADGQCSVSHIKNSSQLSSASITSGSSTPNIVYQRRRLLKSPAPLPWTPISTKTSVNTINHVYERRKNQRNVVNDFSTIVSASTSNGACSLAIESENPSTTLVEKTRGSHGIEATRISSISAIFSNKEYPLITADDCLVEDRGSDVRDKMNKTVELYSVDDSCSSSMINMDSLGLLKSEIDEADECSSSGALVTDVLGDDLSMSVKNLCICILRSHGLLSDFRPNGSGASEEDMPSCSGNSCSRCCNACGLPGTTEEILICDECEEAFHISCCNPSIRKMPIDDWYCQSCFKKKHKIKITKETTVRKSSIIRSDKGYATSERDSSPVALMLKDSEPYTTNVRVGKGFQAIVPEWSGPITGDSDFPEPMELDPSDSINLPRLISRKPPGSRNFIGNWIQCREVIIGIGDASDGTVCGKWRRAPLFEVQNDDWDCFSSVLWDPTYADCAVPQELETEQVLKQLKYIEMLRPRLAAKRRKIEVCKANGSPVPTEDASKCTDSINAASDS